jgi:alkylation response protein AidB-like acyl-CoA dehydrogenase
VDFSYSDDQRMLRETVDRVLAERYDFRSRGGYAQEPHGFSRSIWKQFADLGLLGLPFPEQHGGSGAGAVETMLVMEAFGRALVLEPYLATVVLAGGVLRRAVPGQAARFMPRIAAGDLVFAVALLEPKSGSDPLHVAATARPAGSGWVLDGEKSLVLNAPGADWLVIPAVTSGSKSGDELGLFLVDTKNPGVRLTAYATQDDRSAADVALNSVSVAAGDRLDADDAGREILAAVVDEGMAALCAEAVGAMEQLHTMTLDYLKSRRQFGTSIGSFQALQHRMVDMLVALEQARSMALYATLSLSEPDPATRRTALAAAKTLVGQSARHIGQEAVQLHGAIGMTMEYAGGHLFKRLTAIDAMLGDRHFHLRSLAEAGGLGLG